MLKGLIFDLDGTLVDSLSMTFDAFNYGIMQHGGRRHSPQEIMAHFGPGESEIFARIVGRDQAQSAYQLFLDHIDGNAGRMPLHDGVRELLDRIQERGLPVSIVTGRSWNTTELILKHHGVLDRFTTVICHDHVSQSKPSPEGILLALKRMKLEPSDTCYIGDMPMDIRAAQAAGTHSAAALWDLLTSREEMERHRPDHAFTHPSQIAQAWL